MSIDVDRLRLPAGAVGIPTARAKLPRHAPGQEFLKGPVPLAWLQAASVLPGKALALGLGLWFKAGAQGGNPTVRITGGLLAKFRLTPAAMYRALPALERAGLVSVVRRPGCCHEATILPAPCAARGPPNDG